MNPIELLKAAKKTLPSIPCTSPEFVWVDAASTNVQNTWRKHGWKPLANTIKDDDKKRRLP